MKQKQNQFKKMLKWISFRVLLALAFPIYLIVVLVRASNKALSDSNSSDDGYM